MIYYLTSYPSSATYPIIGINISQSLRYVSLIGNTWNVNFSSVINLWLVQLTAIKPFGISYINFTLQKYTFQKQVFWLQSLLLLSAFKGRLLSPAQFLMIFGCQKYYGGRVIANRWIVN